jgi:hypothetical protein
MLDAFNKGYGIYFTNYKNMLNGFLVSHSSLDSKKVATSLLQQEALHILSDKHGLAMYVFKANFTWAYRSRIEINVTR